MFSGSRAGPPDQDRLRKQSFTAGNRCPNSASTRAAQSSDRQPLSAAAGTIGRGELHEIKHARARIHPSRIDSKLRHRPGAVFFRSEAIANLCPQQQGLSGEVNYTRLSTPERAFIPAGLTPNYVIDKVLFSSSWEIDFWGKYRRP